MIASLTKSLSQSGETPCIAFVKLALSTKDQISGIGDSSMTFMDLDLDA